MSMNTGKQCLRCDYVRKASDPIPDYACPSCGCVYAKVEAQLSAAPKPRKESKFKKLGRALQGAKNGVTSERVEKRKSLNLIVRTYTGKQSQAIINFEKESSILAEEGFEPSNQLWEDGRWGCLAFCIALLLCFIVIGLPILFYLIIVKPDGKLTVTYKRSKSA